MAQALGRSMTLRPERTNVVDVNAVRAYDWQGRHVGYASAVDQGEVRQALRGSGRHSLRGRVVEVNEEHKYVVFECSVETVGEVEDLYPNVCYLDWTYTGPVLNPTSQMLTLEYMMDEIDERLDEYAEWSDGEKDDFIQLALSFCALSRYDLSAEMCDYRRRLCLRLMDIADAALMPLVDELKMAFGRTGRDLHGGDVMNYWMHVLSDLSIVRSLLVHHQDYDLDAIHNQLMQFPEAMYEVWIEDKEHFVTKLLYMHIPREVLWRFVSGIAFYETMKVRCNVCEEQSNGKQSVEDASSPVFLNKDKGQKIDLIRIVNVMYEQGRFRGKAGEKLRKKDVFITIGKALNIDLSDYDKDLSRAMSDSTKLEKHTRVFEDMKEKMIEIWNSR